MRLERARLIRTRSADLIRAGGHGLRQSRPDTCMPPTPEAPCTAEAIHTCCLLGSRSIATWSTWTKGRTRGWGPVRVRMLAKAKAACFSNLRALESSASSNLSRPSGLIRRPHYPGRGRRMGRARPRRRGRHSCDSGGAGGLAAAGYGAGLRYLVPRAGDERKHGALQSGDRKGLQSIPEWLLRWQCLADQVARITWRILRAVPRGSPQSEKGREST